jgi:hypothetical protein
MKDKVEISRKNIPLITPKVPEDSNKNRSKKKDEIDSDEEIDELEEENVPRNIRSTAVPASKQKKVAFEKPREEKPQNRARELPYIDVPPLSKPWKDALKRQERQDNIIDQDKKGPAYRHRAPVQEDRDVGGMVDKMLDASITLSNKEMLALAPEVREGLRKIISKRRMPTEENKKVTMVEEPDMGEPWQQLGYGEEEDAYIDINDLPVAGYMVLDQEFEGLPKGSIIIGDPVQQYLNELDPEEDPKRIYVSKESQALKALYPLINGSGAEEALLDGGSQIVSMDKNIATKLGVSWDPTIIIHMQSANRQVEKTLGLAKNVPFLFGDITVYLQVHIINEPAYKVLLGRPFDALTESEVKNSRDGDQIVTITDPNSGRKIALPTYNRGKTPRIIQKNPEQPSFQPSMS